MFRNQNQANRRQAEVLLLKASSPHQRAPTVCAESRGEQAKRSLEIVECNVQSRLGRRAEMLYVGVGALSRWAWQCRLPGSARENALENAMVFDPWLQP